ncbi:MAG: galactose mutarotase [Lachnospiraceae bacterium]|nr:galactose mutarotase [Lachnospiraceae bacterium]
MKYYISRDNGIVKVTLENNRGMRIETVSAGASLMSVYVPDRNGEFKNVLLSHERPEDYLVNPCFFGSTMGPNTGRMENGRLPIGDREYELSHNEGKHNSHGGFENLARRNWEFTGVFSGDGMAASFETTLRNGVDGYPGNRVFNAEYRLFENNTLEITYTAKSDAATYVNMTSHAYFNLSGDFHRDIYDHNLRIAADYVVLSDEELISRSKVPVAGTCFDFRKETCIGTAKSSGARLSNEIKNDDGYNHAFILNDAKRSITLSHEPSGRKVDISSGAPAVVIYDGYYLEGDSCVPHGAVAIECEDVPNSPNLKWTDTEFLLPGEKYENRIAFKFGLIHDI